MVISKKKKPKIIAISKNPKSKISQPPLSLFATHRGVATPSLKSPGLHVGLVLSVSDIKRNPSFLEFLRLLALHGNNF